MNEIEQVKKALQLFEKGIWWGHIPLPLWCATEHFIAIGDSGSGKTTIIELLLRSVLPRIQPGSKKRALLFDAKGDLYPFLVGLKLKVPIYLLNPFDSRCHAWDMAADVKTFATALEIAAILFPQQNEDKPFFPLAAQAVLAGLMDGFNQTVPAKWTLRDIVLALRDHNSLKAIINRSPNAPQVYEVFLKGDRQSTGDVAATIHTVMTRLTPIAAAWQGRPLRSLSDWCRDESILILGSTPTHEAIVRTLNAGIFHRLSQIILDQPEARTLKPSPQTWVVIDELTFAGHLPNLKHILATARSKGGCFVLGFQHIGPVKEIYKEATGSIVAHCQNRAFLRSTDRETQKFVSEDVGEYDAELPHMGFNEGTSDNYEPTLFGGRPVSYSTSSGKSVQYQRHRLARLSPEQFRQNLYFSHERLNNGIPAYLFTPLLDRPAFVRIPPLFLKEMRVERPEGTLNREPNDDQELKPWTPDDRERVQLSELPPAAQQAVRAHAPDAEFVSASKTAQDGGEVWEVKLRLNGQTPTMVVAADGRILSSDWKPGSEMPSAAQKAVRDRAPNAVIESVSKTTGDGGEVWEVKLRLNGQTPTMVVAADGRILRSDLKPGSEMPPAAQQAVRAHAPNAEIESASKTTGDGGEVWDVKLRLNGQTPKIVVAADGRILSSDVKPDPEMPSRKAYR